MSRHTSLGEPYKVRFRADGCEKIAFITALDKKRAEKKAHDFPNIISITKASIDYIRMESRDFKESTKDILEAKPVTSPIMMDEFIWSRRMRRKNMEKDKTDT